MKAGVFPLNPKSIDRSRILQNNTSITTSFSTIDIRNDQTDDSSSSINFDTLNNNTDANSYRPMNNTICSSQPVFSSLTFSQDAISALDQVLQETISNNSTNNDDNDEDEDYIPHRSTSASSIMISSTKNEEYLKNTSLTIKHNQSNSSQRDTKRKEIPSKVVIIEASNEDGNSNSCIVSIVKMILLDNVLKNISSEKSLRAIQEYQTNNISKIKHQQSILPGQANKRKKGG
ncbi:unnamed protein product [Rotaria sp. Silwood2]|nr:unnamed protein product [Rotaria sp. Silwood2]CAF3025806.1 unnamed protein product [Rotaria sp. Silwood2]CAF3207036.1 unnamed protein product [Rotaria sp. Silwood2]CAF3964390.1 unnamed protein product [Rotaria sp. Silwood2]CAF4053014.1 unnamed protein product [Rotaria sp. Silwood2]